MNLDQFDFDLPRDLIAQAPLDQRGDSRLLHLDATGHYHDRMFADIPDMLRPGDLLVFNDTRVIPARCRGQKSSGGKIEVFLERILDENSALVQIGSNKKVKPGLSFRIGDASGEVLETRNGFFLVKFDQAAQTIFEQFGEMPLPPYIERVVNDSDTERYQTVFAKNPGAVAAPTAGLHFDQAILARLSALGVDSAAITLHVGAGTFQPVRTQRIEDHQMHFERYRVEQETCAKLKACQDRGGRIVAVGTTSARTLESIAREGALKAGSGETDIFIYPGFKFKLVDVLITNFHLPKSTLMMMIAAFAGMEPVMRAYRHAVESRYRFFSYGDAMLLERAA